MPSNDNRLELLLLGRPVIRRNGQELDETPPLKSQALLYYLAVVGQPVSREALAALLWGDMPEATARTNLRLALSRLRKVVGDCLIQDRQTVAFDEGQGAWIDARVFAQNLHGGRTHSTDALRIVTNLYRNQFLAGFSTPDAPAFETWVVTEREWFHQLMLAGLQELLAADRAAGQDADAINVARRMLEIAPWCEEAHQDLMEMLARSGQRSAALTQYDICRHMLDEELGVPPCARTEQLRAQIADGTLASSSWRTIEAIDNLYGTNGPLCAPVALQVRHAPDYPDPLLGRTEAIGQVQALLADPACRLLTLVGAGGVGKTRLALAATADCAGHYAHGAYFIAFAGMKPARQETSADLVISGIGNALGYTFDAQQEPHAILLNHLRDKNLLLICDNFEQLRPAVALLEEIVLTAPGIQLLVTSRERLGSRHEWLYTVDGLAFAPEAISEPACDYPATALFVRSAKRVRADFDPAVEAEHVTQICRLLEGWPLSIELAANWLRLLPCASIAARLYDDVMLLDTATAAPDDRHRSMRAVLDASWELLSADERRVCGGIACFRGGFELSAAQAVVRAGLVQLGSLVDKSLLRRDADGRYHMHEQVRQFALARMEQDPAEAASVNRRHTIYFAAFAAARHSPPGGAPDGETIALFDCELENLRSALMWAIGHEDTERSAVLLESLVPYLRFKGWNREIAELMRKARDLVDAPPALQARWHRWWSDALYNMGDLSAAMQKVEEMMVELGRPLPTTPGRVAWFLLRESAIQLVHRILPGWTFGRASCQRATSVEAALALERYGQIGWFVGNTVNHVVIATINWLERVGAVEFLAGSYSFLAYMLMGLGVDKPASYYYMLAIKYLNRDSNTAHRSFTLEICGFYSFCQGDWASVQRHVEEGIEQAVQSARRRTSLELQLLLAISACVRGQYKTAVEQAAAVLPRAQEYGDTILQAWSLMIQIESCLRSDRDPALRTMPLVQQIQALPSDKINRSELFGIHSSLAVIALRSGNARTVYELDQAQAIISSLKMPISGAFESYANLSEVAVALAESTDVSLTARQKNVQRAGNACATLHKFARTHHFARPRTLIYDGIRQWQQGKSGTALKSWLKAVSAAEKYEMRYDIARAHFEIGRHLAERETLDGHDKAYYLEQAQAEFAEIGAGYMLHRVEQCRSGTEGAVCAVPVDSA